MNRVKYTSTSTGTSTLELSIPSGFQDLSQAVNTYGSSDIFIYTLIDGNGTDWEVGYGTMYGSTFTRVAVFESTNSDSFIDCSANEHTILCHRSFYEGHVITAAYEPESGGGVSVSASSSTSITWANVMGNVITSQPVNGISYAPGAAGNSVAIICSDPASELPYCRGYRVTFVAWCSNSNSGSYFGISIDPDGYGYPLWGNQAPQNSLTGNGSIVQCTTPVLKNLNPWGGSNYGYVPYGGLTYKIYNTDASNSITVYPKVFIEWFL